MISHSDFAQMLVSQDGLRKPEKLKTLIQWYQSDLDEQIETIKIVEFEDGTRMVRDGHHRAVAKYSIFGGLQGNEYDIEKFTYKQFLEVNLDVGWITPFDPRINVRLCDLSHYRHLFEQVKSKVSKDDLKSFIYMCSYTDLYTTPRKKTTHTITGLYNMYKERFIND